MREMRFHPGGGLRIEASGVVFGKQFKSRLVRKWRKIVLLIPENCPDGDQRENADRRRDRLLNRHFAADLFQTDHHLGDFPAFAGSPVLIGMFRHGDASGLGYPLFLSIVHQPSKFCEFAHNSPEEHFFYHFPEFGIAGGSSPMLAASRLGSGTYIFRFFTVKRRSNDNSPSSTVTVSRVLPMMFASS